MMAFGLYKRGQGTWSRGTAAAGLAAVGIWGTLQTYAWMENFTHAKAYYVGYWVPGLILVGFLWGAYYVTNQSKIADFLIETELEMKKVTWPVSREVLVATGVVIVIVVLLAAYLFVVDRLGIEPFFKLIGILPRTATS